MKKKLSFLIISMIFISSCSPVAYQALTYSIDYSKYLDDGFFITESQSVNFDYKPIASVGSDIKPGYLTSKDGSGNVYTEATADDAIAYLVVQAKKVGADAIIGIKIEITDIGGSPYTNTLSYSASGMAIKRK